MREIKFRVYDDLSKKYIQDNKVYILGALVNGKLVFSSENELLKHHHIEQFTGLQDKNGKDIYEGDILHYNTGFAGEPKSRDGIVVWKQGAFGVDNASMQLTWYTDHYGCEIIGNIHEKGKEE